MVRVTIASILTEGDDDLGLHPAQMSGNLCHSFSGIGCIQFAIDVIQEIDMANTEYFSSCKQFGFAHPAQRFQSGITAFTAEPAALPTRRRDEVGFQAFGGVFREYAAIT